MSISTKPTSQPKMRGSFVVGRAVKAPPGATFSSANRNSRAASSRWTASQRYYRRHESDNTATSARRSRYGRGRRAHDADTHAAAAAGRRADMPRPSGAGCILRRADTAERGHPGAGCRDQ